MTPLPSEPRVDWDRAFRYATRIAGWDDGNAEQNLARAYLALRANVLTADEARYLIEHFQLETSYPVLHAKLKGMAEAES